MLLAVRPTCRPVFTVCQLRPASVLRSTVPRRPCTSTRAVVADDAEQRALVGQFDGAELAAGAVELEQQALLAGDVDLAADCAHRVQVQRLGVVGGVQQRLPAGAAVGGAEDQAEGADQIAGRWRSRRRRRGTGSRRPARRSARLPSAAPRRAPRRRHSRPRACSARPSARRPGGRRARASRWRRRRCCAARRRRGRPPSLGRRSGRPPPPGRS